MRGDAERSRLHRRSILDGGARRVAALEGIDLRADVDAAALLPDGTHQAMQVLERVELALAREAQAGAGAVRRKRGGVEPFQVGEPGAAGGRLFLVEGVGRVAARHEQVAVEPGEVALDRLAGADRFDAVDGGAMALHGEARAVL